MATAEGQRAGPDGLLRPLLAQPFDESNLSSLKDNATTVGTSQYLMNKNYWKKCKWSVLRNLSSKIKTRNH